MEKEITLRETIVKKIIELEVKATENKLVIDKHQESMDKGISYPLYELRLVSDAVRENKKLIPQIEILKELAFPYTHKKKSKCEQ